MCITSRRRTTYTSAYVVAAAGKANLQCTCRRWVLRSNTALHMVVCRRTSCHRPHTSTTTMATTATVIATTATVITATRKTLRRV